MSWRRWGDARETRRCRRVAPWAHTRARPRRRRPYHARARAVAQAKLDALAALAAQGRVRDFCAAIVPLDLSAEDAAHFAAGLEADPERRAPPHRTASPSHA